MVMILHEKALEYKAGLNKENIQDAMGLPVPRQMASSAAAERN
jgi:hypothetical protein